MDSEIIEIVEKTGKVLRKTKRSLVYSKGLLHKAVNIVIFNKKGQIYIQKRSKNKSSFPLFWDISASEHTKPQESYKQAAARGVNEELSIKTKLKKIRGVHIQRSRFIKYGKTIVENELVELYIGISDDKIITDQQEIETGKFISLTTLISQMKSKRIKLTPWAQDEIQFLVTNRKLLKLP